MLLFVWLCLFTGVLVLSSSVSFLRCCCCVNRRRTYCNPRTWVLTRRTSSRMWAPYGPMRLRLRLSSVTSDRLLLRAPARLSRRSSVRSVFLRTNCSTSSDVPSTVIMASSYSRRERKAFRSLLATSASLLQTCLSQLQYLSEETPGLIRVFWCSNRFIYLFFKMKVCFIGENHQTQSRCMAWAALITWWKNMADSTLLCGPTLQVNINAFY